MSINISVIICTFNRAILLDGALDSLCRQAIPASSFEILVVDNGSTDNTADCVQSIMEKYPNHIIRRIYEAEQGAGLARNVGLQQARGRYAAFLDDDARAPSDWLAQALERVGVESKQTLLCLGGPIEPFYTSPKPAWFKDAYEIRTWGPEERLLHPGESFSASNMIWYRADLLALGGFAEHMGPTGESLSMGEETAAFLKAWEQIGEPLLLYKPTLIVQHWAPAFKMKVFYQLKRAFSAGQVAMQLNQKPEWSWRLRSFLRNTIDLLSDSFGAIRRFRQHTYWQNWLIEEGQPVMNKLGIVMANLGVYVQVKRG